MDTFKNIAFGELKDTRELVAAVLASVEAGFKVTEDGKVNFKDAGTILEAIDTIRDGIQDAKKVATELAFCTTSQFEAAFEEGAKGFDISGKSALTADIKGITKGVLHSVRVFVRKETLVAA